MVAVLIVVVSAHVVWPTGVVGVPTYVLVTAGAAGAAWVGIWLRRPQPRAAWAWVAVGITASAVGDVVWAVHGWLGWERGDVTWADPFWLGAYIGLAVGVGLLFGRRGHRNLGAEGLLDVLTVVTVSGLVVWHFAIEPTIEDSTVPLLARLVWSAYPVLDTVLVAMVVRLLVNRRSPATSARLLSAGAVCWLIADLVNLVLVSSDVDLARWLDPGWMAGAVLLAAGAWAIPRPQVVGAIEEARPAEEASTPRIVLGLSPLLVPALIEAISFAEGKDANPLPLLAATVLLIGLVMVRSVRLARSRDAVAARLRAGERYFSTLSATSADAVLVVDAQGRIRNEAPTLGRLLGVDVAPTAGRDAFEVIEPADADAARALFTKALLAPGETLTIEIRVLHGDGAHRWLAARVVNLLDDETVGGVVINLHDITDRKTAEEALVHQAFHDSLTGLANRALFREHLNHALRRSARSGRDPAVILLDVDGFKDINDSLGHDIGDTLLCEVGRRLLACVRIEDMVARLGGDEFVVLVEESHDVANEAMAIADRVLETLAEPIVLGDTSVTVSASMGIETAKALSDPASVLRNADIAMYRAKAAGKAQWVLYDPGMRIAAVERIRFESELIVALETGQFELHYQPVVLLSDGAITGFEALLRWNHPELGLLPPDRFIPILEENGLIVPVGAWVLREACHTAATWQRRFPHTPALTMAVNLSGRQLAHADLVAGVTDALERSGLDPHNLILEMTETVLVHDATAAARRLNELRELGTRLAIDDFGTGYSSLSYLRQFPVDILKIDQSFITTIADHGEMPAIVQGLLDLGETLRLEVVAEGIEEVHQLEHLRQGSCGMGQGYLFARPLASDQAEQLLATESVATPSR